MPIIIVLAVGCGRGADDSLIPGADKSLAKVAREINTTLPQMMGDNIRLDKVTGGPGLEFAYFVTLLNEDIADTLLDEAMWKEAALQSKDTRLMLEAGVTIKYHFRNNEGHALETIVVPPSTADATREGSADTTRKEIIGFIQSHRFIEAITLETEVLEEWDHLMFNSSEFTASQAREHIGNLEVKAAKAYDKLGELIPPQCLRSAWEKQVEVAQLYFQACSLLNSSVRNRATTGKQEMQDRINALIYKANDLKTEAGQEMEDVYNEYDVNVFGSETVR